MGTHQHKVLIHPDLEICVSTDKKGHDVYTGTSKKYEPFEATAASAIECFFKFNIQLADQKLIAGFLK